jgi:hypothetical protein
MGKIKVAQSGNSMLITKAVIWCQVILGMKILHCILPFWLWEAESTI